MHCCQPLCSQRLSETVERQPSSDYASWPCNVEQSFRCYPACLRVSGVAVSSWWTQRTLYYQLAQLDAGMSSHSHCNRSIWTMLQKLTSCTNVTSACAALRRVSHLWLLYILKTGHVPRILVAHQPYPRVQWGAPEKSLCVFFSGQPRTCLHNLLSNSWKTSDHGTSGICKFE